MNDILKNMNLFVDGRGHAGSIEELTPPKLTLKTEEFRAGGMDASVEVDMGMEKLEASFSLASYDSGVLKLFGLVQGGHVPLTIKGGLESVNGWIKPVVIQLRGKIKEIDEGNWKPGDKASLKVSMAVVYYKRTVNGEDIHEIDVEGFKRVIDGVDQLAEMRAALGM